jgi:hypothetical protein
MYLKAGIKIPPGPGAVIGPIPKHSQGEKTVTSTGRFTMSSILKLVSRFVFGHCLGLAMVALLTSKL